MIRMTNQKKPITTGSDHSEWGVAAFCMVALFLLLSFNILIFHNFRDGLLKVQEDNMLATAKTVANSLKNFYDRELEELEVYFQGTNGEDRAQLYCKEQEAISYVAVLDQDWNKQVSYGRDYDAYLKQEAALYRLYEAKGVKKTEHAKSAKARLLPAVLTAKNHYTQFLVAPAKVGQEQGWVIAAIEMETVYEKIVKPVQIGQNGYSMVKQFDGTILMHVSADQIGLNAVDGRKEKYEEYQLDFEELEAWVNQQKEVSEGSGLLNSYWWLNDGKPEPSTKVVAYVQKQIGEEIWIVNCTLNYEELSEPIKKARNYVTGGAGLLLLLTAIVLGLGFQSASKHRIMELEVKHLTEMNEAWEELHKQEERLRHADKMKTIGTMTSKISHEFNNFLTPIMLYGDMLKSDETISKQNRTLIGEMILSAEKARELTKELSGYGHRGEDSGKKIVLHIVDEIERSLSLLKKTVPSNICIHQSLEPDEGYGLMGGAGMINQIIVNLCSNAVQAMQETGGCITVNGTFIRDGDDLKYAVTVSDDGPGMPPEVREQIFTPFFTTKKRGEGTGLGLSVVQDLVYAVSGDISVVSAKGKGTRFDILFPVFRTCNISEPCYNK